MTSLLSLPPPLLSAIIVFAVEGLTLDLAPFKGRPPYKRLKDVALVCKATHEIVKDLTRNLQDQNQFLELGEMVDPEDTDEICEDITDGTNFRLRLWPYEPSEGPYDPRNFTTRESDLGDLDQMTLNWDSMFRLKPSLKRLDLSEVPLLSRHLPEILEAVSRRCLHLEILLLPRSNDCFFVVKEVKIRRLMTVLVEVLEFWFVAGSCEGLKQLTMLPCEEGSQLSSTQYVEAVARFCPQIEYIDGFEQVLLSGQEDCSDMWPISLETWQAFNVSCTALRTFNWSVVPFGDPFFRVFGEHVKPQMTSLSLTANMRWGYEHYLRRYPGSVVSVNDWDTHPRYGTSAHNPGCLTRVSRAVQVNY